jgi:hypothetical protein
MASTAEAAGLSSETVTLIPRRTARNAADK